MLVRVVEVILCRFLICLLMKVVVVFVFVIVLFIVEWNLLV